MKKMRRMLSLLMVFSIILSFTVLSASASETTHADALYLYWYNKNWLRLGLPSGVGKL